VTALLLLAVLAAPAGVGVGADTLRLADIRAAAAARDPRAVRPEILDEASRLRLANLRAERLPRLALTGQATYQDDVAALPFQLPGIDAPTPPAAQFRLQVEADQLLFDGGRLSDRHEIERARLQEGRAEASATLLAIREAATEAFFGALLQQSRAEALDLGVTDLDARLAFVRARVRAGAALASEAAALEAEMIRLRQQRDEAAAHRSAALRVLSALTGIDAGADDVLMIPGDELAIPRPPAPARPELDRLAGARRRALAEAALARAGSLPELRLFGQAGVGRPDPFVPFSDEADVFGIVGLRLRWDLVDWGRSRRDARVAGLQARLAELDAEAFTLALDRAAEQHGADAGRLEAGAPDDDRAIALREEVLRVARRQLEEGVLPAPDYVDRLTDLLDARLTRDRHRIELARARAAILSSVGHFPESDRPDAP